MMKLYQGEGLPMVLTPKEGIEDLTKYDIDVALIAETAKSCCSRETLPKAVKYWQKIPVENNAANFGLAAEDTLKLPPGRYFFELALYPKGENTPIKTQTISIIEILPTFTR